MRGSQRFRVSRPEIRGSEGVHLLRQLLQVPLIHSSIVQLLPRQDLRGATVSESAPIWWVSESRARGTHLAVRLSDHFPDDTARARGAEKTSGRAKMGMDGRETDPKDPCPMMSELS